MTVRASSKPMAIISTLVDSTASIANLVDNTS